MSGLPQENAVELLRQIPVNSVVDLLISRQKEFLPREMVCCDVIDAIFMFIVCRKLMKKKLGWKKK